MVSFAARAIEAGIWMWASGLRKKTEAESVQIVIEQTEKNAAAVVLPSRMKYTQNQEQLSGHQEWQVFHLEPKSSARTDSVVVFWHGGGFVNNVDKLHHVAIRKFTETFGLPLILPIYTLAPRATGKEFVMAAVDLLARLQCDSRYRGKRIILVGDSAGGYLSAHLFAVLTNMACGSGDFTYAGQDQLLASIGLDKIRETRRLIDTVFLFSAMTESYPPDEDTEVEKVDPALRLTMLRTFARIWAYGINAFPSQDLQVSPEIARIQQYDAHPLHHAAHSPSSGVDALARYHELGIGGRAPAIIQFCGTHDVLLPGNARYHQKLQQLGSEVVETQLHIYPGLFHVFQGLEFLPESKDVWNKVGQVLQERSDIDLV